MSSYESPNLTSSGHHVTVDELRSLTAAATPHFAMQVRERVKRLIADLAADDPARIFGEEQLQRLAELGQSGEVRGTQNEPTLDPLDSVTKGE